MKEEAVDNRQDRDEFGKQFHSLTLPLGRGDLRHLVAQDAIWPQRNDLHRHLTSPGSPLYE